MKNMNSQKQPNPTEHLVSLCLCIVKCTRVREEKVREQKCIFKGSSVMSVWIFEEHFLNGHGLNDKVITLTDDGWSQKHYVFHVWKGLWRISLDRSVRTDSTLTAVCMFHVPQAGGGCGGGLHTRAADEERGRAHDTVWHHGRAWSSSGHISLHGPVPAEVPPHHQEAALPQHGEHPEAPRFLPRQ